MFQRFTRVTVLCQKVTHVTNDENWRTPGSSKKVYAAKSHTQKGGFASVDRVLKRFENWYWKIQVDKLKSEFDGIICGFCLPYLSQNDRVKLISDAYNLLSGNGLIYISFVEDDPNKSDFQVGSGGDRSYFYYHNLDELKK